MKKNIQNSRFSFKSLQICLVSIKDLSIWIIVSFILPIIQIFIINFSNSPLKTDNKEVYSIIFVSITSFLTNVFFVTDFWKKNRGYLKVILILSYLISFALFIISLISDLFEILIFDLSIYKYGILIALISTIIIAFFCKYDKNVAISQEIAKDASKKTHGYIGDTEFRI